MKNRVALFGTAVALVLGGLPAGAGAATVTYDTSGATVTCNTVIGTASIKPPISPTSTGTAQIKVKATLGGCAVTGATPSDPMAPANPTIVSGSVGGTLNTVGGAGCTGLLAPATITGNLVAKWKAASGQKLDVSSTTAANGTITGTTFMPGGGFGAAQYGQFTLSGQSLVAPSAFGGGTPSTVAVTGEDILNLGVQCLTALPGKGIKTIHLAIGTLTL